MLITSMMLTIYSYERNHNALERQKNKAINACQSQYFDDGAYFSIKGPRRQPMLHAHYCIF